MHTSSDTRDPRSPAEWLTAIRERESRGDLLGAFDTAERALERFPDDTALKHRSVLVLARAGAAAEALRRFHALALGDSESAEIAALEARLSKDRALAERDPRRRKELTARAARHYADVYERTGDTYPGINAATLWLLAGDAARSRELAERVLDETRAPDEASGEAAYYREATVAEALFLLGRAEYARAALARAAEALPDDVSAWSTTRKQLSRILAALSLSRDLLAPLTPPTVAHITGHIASPPGRGGKFPAEAEASVARRAARVVAEHDVRLGFGSLAAGADIVVAEAILDRGGELHVVLPFREDEFVERSVRPSGAAWVERYQRCRERAAALSYATHDRYLDDSMLFGYCARYAMGLAILRSRQLDAPLLQIAVWDGQLAGRGAVAGTATDVAGWRELGLPQIIIDSESTAEADRSGAGPPSRPSLQSLEPTGAAAGPPARAAGHQRHDDQPATGASAEPGGLRRNRALLFADVKGYSKLFDDEILSFHRHVLPHIADVLAPYERYTESVDSWGDAIFAVFHDVSHAAHCALDLQERVAALDVASLGLSAELMLRMGLHYGPVIPIEDPIRGARTSVGAHVNLAARIEPVAMPGSVYVSEPFAAMLALGGDSELGADYVGTVDAAKDYGALALYRLRR